ncbi:hypothetical protein TNCT_627561 [Trichonephila clavata]|uniref:Uncharacterized protein n=1 Tax=Trichonephila clavata TaxID=2740835 RepID=A0A8X6H738_TRICU|nr:hypothetical protein TNCT_627561 [Trichonephila clavata]
MIGSKRRFVCGFSLNKNFLNGVMITELSGGNGFSPIVDGNAFQIGEEKFSRLWIPNNAALVRIRNDGMGRFLLIGGINHVLVLGMDLKGREGVF